MSSPVPDIGRIVRFFGRKPDGCVGCYPVKTWTWPPGERGTTPAWPRPMPYERRRPKNSTLHRVVRENLKTLYAATDDGETGAALPRFVRKELESYLDCGLLARGFAVVACT